MSLLRRYLLLFCLVVSLMSLVVTADEEASLRTWSDASGRFEVQATFVGYRGGKVQLQRIDGKLLTVELARLSLADRNYVRQLLNGPTPADEVAPTKETPVEPKTAGPTSEAPKAGAPSDDAPPAGAKLAATSDVRDSTPSIAKEAISKSPPDAPPRRVGPPDPDCPVCRGLGLVPAERFQPYTHVEGRPTPKPTESICGRYCSECQAGKDPTVLLDIEAARLETAGERHKEWEEKLQMELTRIETHQLVIHAQIPLAEARRVALAVEAMTAHLQQLTGSLKLTPRRPAVDDMFIFTDHIGYEQLIALLEKEERYKHIQWDLMRKMSGATIDRVSMMRRTSNVPFEDIAVHNSAFRQIQLATANRAPAWLNDGFAAYCEFAVMRQNLIHAVNAQSTNVRLDLDWDTQVRQFARLGMLRTWEEMFKRDLGEFEQVDYVEAKSMVAFLLREPEKFLTFVDQISIGADSAAALTEAYGEPVEDLEKQWRRSVGAR